MSSHKRFARITGNLDFQAVIPISLQRKSEAQYQAFLLETTLNQPKCLLGKVTVNMIRGD